MISAVRGKDSVLSTVCATSCGWMKVDGVVGHLDYGGAGAGGWLAIGKGAADFRRAVRVCGGEKLRACRGAAGGDHIDALERIAREVLCRPGAVSGESNSAAGVLGNRVCAIQRVIGALRAAFVIEVRFHPSIELEARLAIEGRVTNKGVFHIVGADSPRPRSDARAIACAKPICREARTDPRKT